MTLRPEDLRRFESFHFAVRILVEGFYSGRHRSPYYDASAEFADYRPYVPGDEIRSLDWRAYARTDRDYVKLFRKSTDMRCHVLLDTSASMGFRDDPPAQRVPGPGLGELLRRRKPERSSPSNGPLSKLEYGAYLAAALCYLMVRQGDKVSLALGGAQFEKLTPPGGTMNHLKSLLNTLEGAQAKGPTDLASVLKLLFSAARRRGLLVVISDFLEEPGPLFHSLGMFVHRGWQVLLLQVLTDTEMELAGEGAAQFVDPESHDCLDADVDAIRVSYCAELDRFLGELERQAKARAIHYQRTTTSAPYTAAIERYLSTRIPGGDHA
jgi:uncharacterized protein (DUF58 family)